MILQEKALFQLEWFKLQVTENSLKMVLTRRTSGSGSAEKGRLPGCSASYQHQSGPELFPCLAQFSTALTFYPKAHYLHCPKRLPVTKSSACFLLHIWLFVVLTKEQESFSLRTSPQTFPPVLLSTLAYTCLPNPEQALWGGH